MNRIIIMLFGFILCNKTYAGNSVGNGGDFVAIEFVKTAQKVVTLLKGKRLSNELSIAVNQVGNRLASTRVSSIRSLQLNGKDVDAINYPNENKITVSQVGWYFIKQQDVVSRVTLVLHEYLGVSGFADKEYQISIKLAEMVSAEVKFEPSSKDRFVDQLSCLRSFELEVKSAIATSESFNTPLIPTIFCKNLGAAYACASFARKSMSDNPDWFTAQKRDARKMQESLEYFIGMNRYCSADVLQIDLKKELQFLEAFDIQIKKIIEMMNYLDEIGNSDPIKP